MGNAYDQKENKQQVFKAHIAIDFGTDGCGLAFAYNGNVTVYNKWKAKKRQRVVKAPTQILLNDKDEVIAFGNNAKIMYSNLTGTEKKEWKFFERFKMSLYGDHLINDDDESNDDEKKAGYNIWSAVSTMGGYAYSATAKMGSYAPKKWQKNASKWSKAAVNNMYYYYHDMDKKHVINHKEFYLEAVNGKQCEANVIFVAVFEHLAQIAKEYLAKITNDAEITDDEIQWIVTVPAIWSTKSIRKMRKWIIEAGLTNCDIEDQCKIVYEPDCAALAIYYHLKQQNKNINKEEDETETETKTEDEFPSNKYILIDAGGGTVDIACHEILRDKCLSVQEVHYPTGGKWGGCFINDQYIKLLQAIFSKEWMEEFKEDSPNVYVEIIDNFENAKTLFYENPNVDTSHNVELPHEFIQFLAEKNIDNNLKEKINEIRKKDISYFKQIFCPEMKTEDNEDNKEAASDEEEDEFCEASCVLILSDTDESLIIDVEIWKCIFDSMIDDIIDHIKELLEEECLQKGCNHLYLVGGMACSKYYQYRMIQEFGKKVIIPPNPTLMVVTGAAYFGITNNYIKARILKHSYGITMSVSESLAVQRGISKEYIQEKSNRTQDGQIKNCFIPFFLKNELVPIGEVRTLDVTSNVNTECTQIPIFRSDLIDPKVASDGKQVEELTILHDKKRKVIKLECTFNETSLTLFYWIDGVKIDQDWAFIEYV